MSKRATKALDGHEHLMLRQVAGRSEVAIDVELTDDGYTVVVYAPGSRSAVTLDVPLVAPR